MTDLLTKNGLFAANADSQLPLGLVIRNPSNPGAKGFPNTFKRDRDVVFDSTADLMWQRSGSTMRVSLREAAAYVDSLNKSSFAGYADWRLPTLEEAMSLVEPRAIEGLHLDALFDRLQTTLWTSDSDQRRKLVWVVLLDDGQCRSTAPVDLTNGRPLLHFVRAVRSRSGGPPTLSSEIRTASIDISRVAAESLEGKAAVAQVRALTDKKAPQSEVQRLQQELMVAFERKVAPAIRQVATQRGFRIVLNMRDGVIWADDGAVQAIPDITDDVIKQLDAAASPESNR